jgi:hypothetical protein
MTPDILALAAPAVIGAASIGAYFFARWWANPAVRALRRAPRRSIDAFPEGTPGRIVGVIEAYEGRTVETPLTTRACVAYSVQVDEYRRQGRSGSWEPIVRDFDAVNFVVSDGTGRALVRAAGSWPSPVMRRVAGSGLLESPSPALEALLSAHGQSSHGLLFKKNLRAMEGVLAVGARVAVLGIGRRSNEPLEGAAEGSYRQSPGTLVIECLDDGTLLMSDEPSTLR